MQPEDLPELLVTSGALLEILKLLDFRGGFFPGAAVFSGAGRQMCGVKEFQNILTHDGIGISQSFLREFVEELLVGSIAENVFAGARDAASIKIDIGQLDVSSPDLAKQTAVNIDCLVYAVQIDLLCLRCRNLEGQGIERPDFGNPP